MVHALRLRNCFRTGEPGASAPGFRDPRADARGSPSVLKQPLNEPFSTANGRCGLIRAAALLIVATAVHVAFALGAEAKTPKEVPLKVDRYAKRLVERYDRNGDGKLEQEEWHQMHGQPASADADRDGVITVEELAQWVAAFGAQRRLRLAYPASAGTEGSAPPRESPPDNAAPAPVRPVPKASPRQTKFYVTPKRLPAGLPDWFLQRDADGDGQLTFSEYAPKATAAERQEYARYDLNGDGVLTPQEYLKATTPPKPAKSRAKP